MDTEVFQEKMDPTHRAMLCRMVKTEQLPLCLLMEYRKAKRLVDCIDARLAPGELAIITLASGFNPDTGKFLTFAATTEGEDARLQSEAKKLAAEPVKEAPAMTGEQAEAAIASGTATPVGALDERILESSALEQPVEAPVEKTVPEEQPAAAEQPTAKLWAPGMPVRVLQEDELKRGKIVNVNSPPPGSEQKVWLTVEFEGGGTATVEEDEVEAD